MGRIVEKTKTRKKKGRPSLLDIQKRTLKHEQEQQQQNRRNISAPQSTSIYTPATATPLRRSTRRNPNPSPEGDEDEDELSGRRREKKLKLVLKLPSQQKSTNGSPDCYASNYIPDDSSGTQSQKKRKINAIDNVSGAVQSEKGEKSVSGAKLTASNSQEILLDSRCSTPLPDKKLLVFILDRLQKKDTFGVFSEPVDPEELPDYHEIIEHPMDFGTIRKKLDGGAYANLEQFEKDVFLISLNAMQYNAPDTIYFRQARSIKELAKKNFENLRQDSDDNDLETKVVRRGGPQSKSVKKPVGRPALERTASEFSSGATLATGTESTIWPMNDARKAPIPSNKSGFSDSEGNFYVSQNDIYTGRLAENKIDKSDEGSSVKGTVKFGKRYFVVDENRRTTYKEFHQSAGARGLSVLSAFDGNMRQLMPVGVYTDHGYARSLARFAANLGPIARKIASGRIQACLPSGTNFGPGWVGENDLPSEGPLLHSLRSDELSRFWPYPAPQNLCSTTTARSLELKGDGLQPQERLVPSVSSSASDVSLSKCKPPSVPNCTSAFAVNKSPEAHTKDNSRGTPKLRPSSQIHQTSQTHLAINGFTSPHGFKLPGQVGKPVGTTRPPGFDFPSSQMLQTVNTNRNNFVPVSTSSSSNNPRFSENSSPTTPSPVSTCHTVAVPTQKSWQGRQRNRNAESKTSPDRCHFHLT